MRNKTNNKFLIFGLLALILSSCTKDLNRFPSTSVTSASVFNNPTTISQAFAKLYGGLSLSGQTTADGFSADIAASDVGSNVYLRNYWETQELPTDEAVIAWNDGNLQQYHLMDWTYTNDFIRIMYYRVMLEVSLCNEFLRETTSAKLTANGISPNDAVIQEYRTEARFLRALAYWHGIDLFGDLPFVTEADPVGSFFPVQKSKADIFKFIESELTAIQATLPDPRKNDYGRADKAYAWTLLAKLYLNAKTYTGTDRSTDVITYCNKVINSGAYSLAANYAQLFETDSRNTNEIIFPIRANGLTSQSYGNTTFLVHAAIGGSMNASNFGVGGGWGGLRTTKNIVDLFPDPNGTADKRAMFYTNGQNKEISDIKSFTDGFAVTKFKNVSSTGVKGSDPSGNFVDTDFPMFRLGDVYLMYAEAVLRNGSGGDVTTALSYINALRDRAYGNNSGEITAPTLNLDFILQERGRELYWEAHRRTDLIRFGKFTDASYVWPWKGGASGGTGVDTHYNLFPIPITEMLANPTLKQNPGY